MDHVRPKLVHVSAVGITATKLLLPQSHACRDNGIDVSFVFSPGPAAEEVRKHGFHVEEIPVSRKISLVEDWRSIRMMRDYFRRLIPDLVHTHTSKGGFVGRIAAALARVPHIIHTAHGYPFHVGMSPLKYWAFVGVEFSLARVCDAVLSQSQEDVEISRRYRIHSINGPVKLLGNGIQLDQFDPSLFTPEAKRWKRAEVGVRPDVPIICTIARVNEEKGYLDLIDGLEHVKDLDWEALFVGPDEGLMAEVRARLTAKGLARRVKVLGIRHDIAELLAITDIYVLASYREGVPRSVIEAQAMGIPAVVTNVRGSREVVLHEETGLIVPPHSPAQLADGLRSLLLDNARRVRLGEAGRTRALENFDERTVCDRLLTTYREVLSRKGNGG